MGQPPGSFRQRCGCLRTACHSCGASLPDNRRLKVDCARNQVEYPGVPLLAPGKRKGNSEQIIRSFKPPAYNLGRPFYVLVFSVDRVHKQLLPGNVRGQGLGDQGYGVGKEEFSPVRSRRSLWPRFLALAASSRGASALGSVQVGLEHLPEKKRKVSRKVSHPPWTEYAQSDC